MHRAGIDAISATDTFITVGRLSRIDPHLAGLGAYTAIHAFLFIHTHADQAYFLKKSVKSSQWTNVFTKRSVDKYR